MGSGRDENLKILSLQQQGPKSSPLSLIPWLTLEPHVSQLCHHSKGAAGHSAQPFWWETQIPSFCLICSPKMSVNFPPDWESPHLYFCFPA